jgi:hypothetical protein
VFEESAKRHSISENDALHCIEYFVHSNIVEFVPPRVLFIGWSSDGRPLEVIAKDLGDKLSVYHAMPLRKNWFYLLEGGGKNDYRR